MAGAEMLNAGRIGRPHGLDGSFHVTRARAVLLALGGDVRIDADVREIVRRSGTDDRPILRLHGVDDRAGAEELRGKDLLVARTAAPELAPGEYWAEDLEGCRVVTERGREIGVVGGLRALPSCEVLEVGELLVPMVGDAVHAVDIAERRIVVDAEFLGLALDDLPGPDAPGPGPDAPAPAADVSAPVTDAPGPAADAPAPAADAPAPAADDPAPAADAPPRG